MEVLGVKPEVWFPVVSVICSVVLTGLLGFLQSIWSSRVEQKARNEQRRQEAVLRRNEFQRSTLLKLQEDSIALGRAIQSFVNPYVVHHRTDGSTPDIAEVKPLHDAAMAAFVPLRVQMVRVRHAGLRSVVMGMAKLGSEATAIDDPEVMDARLITFFERQATVNSLVGMILQQIDDVEEQALNQWGSELLAEAENA